MRRQQVPPEIEIEPIPFRTDPASEKPLWIRGSARLKWMIAAALGLVFACLIVAAGFVFTAGRVEIDITPAPDRVRVAGAMAPRLGDSYLLRPGRYTVHAEKKGYRSLDEAFRVADRKGRTLQFTLLKLPGRLFVTAHRKADPETAITGAAVYVDGEAIGKTPIEAAPVDAGLRRIRIQAENYQVEELTVAVTGMDEVQALNVALVPGWASVMIRSDPAGATVHIDGEPKGRTPLEAALPEGEYELRLSAERFTDVTMRLSVAADKPKILDTIRLAPRDGLLALQTEPNGASVVVDETYAGQTPLDIPLAPGREHLVRLSKAGYSPATRTVMLAAAEKKSMRVTLSPKEGVVHLSIDPPDAVLYIDGIRQDSVPERLALIAVEHTLEVKKEGYTPHSVRITPRPGFSQKLTIALDPVRPEKTTLPAVIQAANGYRLNLVRPEPFVMGSSRREQGRRSNESLRNIVLKRPFYMGTREVSNQQVRAFLSHHDSGAFGTHSLNRDSQPAVRITWIAAVRFLNWLSRQDGLVPVYTVDGDRVTAADPMGTGYRLPTEAEWEYCARFQKNGAPRKYPWGDRFPPENRTVNIADASAKDLLSAILESYDDGYPVSAPPGAFEANDLGLFDLGGNVAEWCHDYYAIYPYSSEKVDTDPSGPKQGKHRVVRGSSWRHAGISALRAAYRDYSHTDRPDLGFRICRYAE